MGNKLFDKAMSQMVQRGQLEITYASGQRVTFGQPDAGFPNVSVRFADGKVPRDIMLDPRLGAAEAYMDGRLILEQGEVMDLVQLVQSNNPWERRGKLGRMSLSRRLRNRVEFIARSFNKPGTSKRNVAHHYDIGNDLYQLMLDPEHMQYSCAYWPDENMTLEQAQEAKLAHIAAKLALEPGQRVLDIGCGWGGMAIYLARKADVTVLGITLSEEQLQLARRRAAAAGVSDRVRFELIDYRELARGEERFDRIVSVGMFEHVGTPQYETFFRNCASLLKDDGVMLLHTIGRMGKPGWTDAFTDKYVFPGGYIPALSETVAASEKSRLIASDIEMLRLHYAKTLREWYRRCMEHREEIIEMFDERFFRMWTFYLSGSTAAFETGGMCNYQIQYIRNRHALPITRAYIAANEHSLKTERSQAAE